MKITGTHLGIALIVLFFMSQTLMADQLKHKFKNPSFSGIGTGAHYLTIENQEKSRKDKIRDDIEAALRAADRLENNSTINKFIRNLEWRTHFYLNPRDTPNMKENYGFKSLNAPPRTPELRPFEDSLLHLIQNIEFSTISNPYLNTLKNEVKKIEKKAVI